MSLFKGIQPKPPMEIEFPQKEEAESDEDLYVESERMPSKTSFSSLPVMIIAMLVSTIVIFSVAIPVLNTSISQTSGNVSNVNSVGLSLVNGTIPLMKTMAILVFIAVIVIMMLRFIA